MKSGRDYIGVGCGAIIKDKKGRVLLMMRGPKSKSEAGTWCIPGGEVEYGEKMEKAVVREIKEELGVDIEVVKQYGCANHIMPKEGKHWVSAIFLCKIKRGTPKIMEKEKCTELGWFSEAQMRKLKFGVIMKENFKLIKKYEQTLFTN